ncbi:unnamed protein product [Tilletia caries]|nr:unnamed protein product [Tilletia caries]
MLSLDLQSPITIHNVAGLETTATFDKASAIIHSSTLTSTKWWAGGLGTTATHAVVQAQLILDGKGIGPHLFFVPLRSVETGQLFEGVHAGDIGPKAYGAFGGLDNGWARSDHYRIPRENMFMKHSQVTKEGQYVKPPSSKMSYLGLTFIRSQMIDRCGWMLSRGITIAIRYSSVRRQFRGPDSTTKSDEERAVISKPRSLTSGWRLYDIRLAPDVASDVVYNPKRLFGVITLDVNRASTFLSGIANFKPAKVNVPIFGGDELVKVKDGAGKATLSMAYAAAVFSGDLIRALRPKRRERTVSSSAHIHVQHCSLHAKLAFIHNPYVIS